MKRLLMIAAAVAVLGLATVAIGGAITSAQEGDGPIGTLLAKVADKLGVSEEELQTAFDEARDETIDEKVAEGLLTEEQAERLKERAAEGGPLFPPRPHHRPNGKGHHVIDAALQLLDMEKDELREQFSEGNSLAEIAEAQGMNAEDFEVKLAGVIQADIDAKVASGDITQEQADRLSEGLKDRIDNIVNAQPGESGFGGPRHRRGGFGGPWHAPLDEAEESSDVSA